MSGPPPSQGRTGSEVMAGQGDPSGSPDGSLDGGLAGRVPGAGPEAGAFPTELLGPTAGEMVRTATRAAGCQDAAAASARAGPPSPSGDGSPSVLAGLARRDDRAVLVEQVAYGGQVKLLGVDP